MHTQEAFEGEFDKDNIYFPLKRLRDEAVGTLEGLRAPRSADSYVGDQGMPVQPSAGDVHPVGDASLQDTPQGDGGVIMPPATTGERSTTSAPSGQGNAGMTMPPSGERSASSSSPAQDSAGVTMPPSGERSSSSSSPAGQGGVVSTADVTSPGGIIHMANIVATDAPAVGTASGDA